MKRNRQDPMFAAIADFWRDRREYLRLVNLLHKYCAEELNRNAPTDTSEHLLPNADGLRAFYCRDAIDEVWSRLAYNPKTLLNKAAHERLIAVPENNRHAHLTGLILCNGRPYGAAALIADAARQYDKTRSKTFHTKPTTAKGARAALQFIAALGHGNTNDPGYSTNAMPELYVRWLVKACVPFMKPA